MTELAALIEETRATRPHDPKQYISAWTEPELLDGKVVDAFVLILRTKGCYWARKSGCSMCGYVSDGYVNVSEEDLLTQWSAALEVYQGQPVVKLYNSGNFFDPSEIPAAARRRILRDLGGRCEKVVVENLPQLVRTPLLEEALDLCPRFEVAIGLETASDYLRDHTVSKDFTFAHYEEAVGVAHAAGVSVKTYLLFKPPFLSERAAMHDTIASVQAIDGLSDTISINPTNVQRDTLVDRLYRRGEYRPPWLWSLVEVLKAVRRTESRVLSKPTGGGHHRGTHNCGHCDAVVLRAVEDYSLQREDWLDEPTCSCHEDWDTYLRVEDLARASVDLDRFLA
ncbi:MAG: archaeosine biosynthesis radical SAM protein RaSEA [Thermoplasmata archaeon]